MIVTKRNGNTESVKFDKITERINRFILPSEKDILDATASPLKPFAFSIHGSILLSVEAETWFSTHHIISMGKSTVNTLARFKGPTCMFSTTEGYSVGNRANNCPAAA